MINYVYILFSCMITVLCLPKWDQQGKRLCKELPREVLEETLGPAFNVRYMRVHQPPSVMSRNYKRKTEDEFDFDTDSHGDDFGEKPAWNVTNHVKETKAYADHRYKRHADYLPEWHCKSRTKWTDLGPDYFPRYLRSVECLTETCWFNMYNCRPRSFTVKILKRKRDRCVPVEQGHKIGVSGLLRDLMELWVWEERVVNFCCDCSL